MKKLIVFILLFLPFALISQTLQIQGIITDSINKKPVPYSTIVIKNHNDSTITGTLGDEKGEFSCSFKKPDNYKLVISNIGYKEKTLFFDDEKNSNKHDFGVIELSPITHQLSETQVTASRPYMQQKFDRKVFSVGNIQAKSARTILDLLKTLPGVVVDEDGSVYFKGAEATIYVDDLLMKYVYPKLEMIPVDKVKKIELIDVAMNTGGDGRGGIINILMKTETVDGISGSVSSTINTQDFKKISSTKNYLNLNYKIKSLTFFINSSYDYNFNYTNSTTQKDINNQNGQNFQEFISYRQNINRLNYNNAGVYYKPSDNTTLYATYGLYFSKPDGNGNTAFREEKSANNLLLNKYDNNNNYTDKQDYNGFTISFKHKFDTLDTYFKSYVHINRYNGSSNNFSEYDFNHLNAQQIDSVYNFKNNGKFFSKNIYSNFFYNHSITPKTRFNISYNLYLSLQDSSANEHYIFDIISLPESQFAIYADQKHDLSFRFGTELKKWKLDGGIGLSCKKINGKYYRYNTDNSDTIIDLSKTYFRILPSFTFAYSINEKQDIKLTLSKTAEMPYFNDLCDFIDKKNIYYWQSGNSGLLPTDFYSVYLGYNYNTEKLNASVECFYNYTDNHSETVSIPVSSLIYISKPMNVAIKKNFGVDLAFWYKARQNLSFSLSSSIFNNYYNIKSLTDLAQEFELPFVNYEHSQYGYYIKGNIDYRIKNTYYLSFYARYNSKLITYNGYYKPWLNSSAYVSRYFLKNKLFVSLGVSNVFDEMIVRGLNSEIFGVKTDYQYSGSAYKRTFYFSLRYNILHGDRGTRDYK